VEAEGVEAEDQDRVIIQGGSGNLKSIAGCRC
jgi:hypothetical protein